MSNTNKHRSITVLDEADQSLLRDLVKIYGSEAQSIRVAIRTLAAKHQREETK